ncbi:HAD family hydrolase [Kitasatospora viridis]|uniref:Putative hydrolase of the HAD superfamily n=1 Tax=Kitasatospora viridis TaxID=281105 RepID=A0A561TTY1_9ACTN|nr:HAD family hydrolase [Kitasatospora viridis]TWF90547.1 putative hydrolase of the HAD superfamily [Kitasatospora viridis]
MRRDNQVLVLDADDTLWENNIRFERAIEGFLDLVTGPAGDRAAARAALDRIEAANARALGYGSKVFGQSLLECFELLRQRPAEPHEAGRMGELAASITAAEVELIPGVAQTLAELAARHRLLLLTKGDTAEQQAKVDNSGLAHHFQSVHIVAEKDVTAYHRLIGEQALAPRSTWMIGNSVKSDILPARAAGLNAVFIPNRHTWVLEDAELDPADTGVLHLSAFAELGEHF